MIDYYGFNPLMKALLMPLDRNIFGMGFDENFDEQKKKSKHQKRIEELNLLLSKHKYFNLSLEEVNLLKKEKKLIIKQREG